jgi:hypothetical protein
MIWRFRPGLSSVEAEEGSDERATPRTRCKAVDAGDEVEEVAADVERHEDVLQASCFQASHWPARKTMPRKMRRGEPGHGAAAGGAAEAEPLVHDVELAEHLAAGDLGGDGAEERTAVLSQRMGGMAVGSHWLM